MMRWTLVGSIRNKTSYGTMHQSPLQCWCNCRLQNRQGCVSSRNICPFRKKSSSRSRRKTSFWEAHSCLLCWKHAWIFTTNLAEVLEGQRPWYEDLWPNASWCCKQNELHPAHEEQQVLHLSQGLRGQQPTGGWSHLLRVCACDHIWQFRATIFRCLRLGSILNNTGRERYSQLERCSPLDTKWEVSSNAAWGKEGSEAFSVACQALEVWSFPHDPPFNLVQQSFPGKT